MRYATIALDQASPPLVLTVSALPPQNLLANVNRWEGQVGAPSTSGDQLERVVRSIDLGSDRANIIDVAGPSQRILGALVEHERTCWSFKIMGSPVAVEAQRQRFESFLRSVRF